MSKRIILHDDCLNIGCMFWNNQLVRNCTLDFAPSKIWKRTYCDNQPIPKKPNRREVDNSGNNTKSNKQETT